MPIFFYFDYDFFYQAAMSPQQSQQQRENRKIENQALIDQYKKDIDLTSYLHSIGYTYNKEKSTRNWPMMVEPETGRKLLLGRNRQSGDNYYFNPEDSRDSGTILHLVAAHKRLDLSTGEGWNELHRVCGDLIGNAQYQYHDPIQSSSRLATTPTNREGAVADYYRLKPLTDTDYLTGERLIDPRTLQAPEFWHKILNKSFTCKHPGQEDLVRGTNTVFPLENELGVQGIIVRQTAWNHTYGDKSMSVWISNIIPGQPVKEVFISENPINCLSYHQLNPPAEPGARVYIATGGQAGHDQYLTIQNILNKVNPETLLLANDNDLSGIRFNINALSRLQMPRQPLSAITMHVANAKHTTTLSVELIPTRTPAGVPAPSPHEQAVALEKRINEVLNRNMPKDGPRATLERITNRQEMMQIRVTFPNQRPLLIRAENLAKEFRQSGDYIRVIRSIECDFNDDLKVKLAKQGKTPTETMPVLAQIARIIHAKKSSPNRTATASAPKTPQPSDSPVKQQGVTTKTTRAPCQTKGPTPERSSGQKTVPLRKNSLQ